jgi:hypothetical protein
MKATLIAMVFATSAALMPAAHAQEDSMTMAVALGDVLGSEEFCDLKYDQNAIQQFIDKNVKKDDMQFPSSLKMMTEGARDQNKDLSPSAKTAHCEQIGRVARSYGFIQ